jgi:O-antigen ligase
MRARYWSMLLSGADGLPRWFVIVLYAVFALMPWSVTLNLTASATIEWPIEPLLGALALGAIPICWRQWRTPNILVWIPRIWLIWQVITTIASTDWVVSAKCTLVSGAHFLIFFEIALLFPSFWIRLLRVFAVSMAGVVLWTVTRHSLFFDWRADQANLAPMPFFPDHTMYATVVAMCLFVALAWRSQWRWPLVALLTVGLVTSTCRAAIGSVILVCVAALVVRIFFGSVEILGRTCFHQSSLMPPKTSNQPQYRIPLKDFKVTILFAAILTGALALLDNQWNQIGPTLRQKVSNDVSTLERLNRYDCVFQMADLRPLLGFGPGMYQHAYIPFQRPAYSTRISVVAPIQHRSPSNYGRGGGAHAESLAALAETGWLGAFIWFWLVALIFVLMTKRPVQWLSLALFSYMIHTIVNQFLHDARCATLVWGCLAILLTDNFFKNFLLENLRKA